MHVAAACPTARALANNGRIWPIGTRIENPDVDSLDCEVDGLVRRSRSAIRRPRPGAQAWVEVVKKGQRPPQYPHPAALGVEFMRCS